MNHVQNSSLNTSNNYKIEKAVILPSSYIRIPSAMQPGTVCERSDARGLASEEPGFSFFSKRGCFLLFNSPQISSEKVVKDSLKQCL